MTNENLKNGITETLEILKHIDKTYTMKVPQNFWEFLNENKSETYIPKIDFSKKLKDLDLKDETKSLLGIMYLNYWSTEEEKKEFSKLLDDNELKYEAEIKEKYSIDKLFQKKQEKKANINNEVALIPVKESILKRLWNKILNIINYKK